MPKTVFPAIRIYKNVQYLKGALESKTYFLKPVLGVLANFRK
jgi:hypothetical protein